MEQKLHGKTEKTLQRMYKASVKMYALHGEGKTFCPNDIAGEFKVTRGLGAILALSGLITKRRKGVYTWTGPAPTMEIVAQARTNYKKMLAEGTDLEPIPPESTPIKPLSNGSLFGLVPESTPPKGELVPRPCSGGCRNIQLDENRLAMVALRFGISYQEFDDFKVGILEALQ